MADFDAQMSYAVNDLSQSDLLRLIYELMSRRPVPQMQDRLQVNLNPATVLLLPRFGLVFPDVTTLDGMITYCNREKILEVGVSLLADATEQAGYLPALMREIRANHAGFADPRVLLAKFAVFDDAPPPQQMVAAAAAAADAVPLIAPTSSDLTYATSVFATRQRQILYGENVSLVTITGDLYGRGTRKGSLESRDSLEEMTKKADIVAFSCPVSKGPTLLSTRVVAMWQGMTWRKLAVSGYTAVPLDVVLPLDVSTILTVMLDPGSTRVSNWFLAARDHKLVEVRGGRDLKVPTGTPDGQRVFSVECRVESTATCWIRNVADRVVYVYDHAITTDTLYMFERMGKTTGLWPCSLPIDLLHPAESRVTCHGFSSYALGRCQLAMASRTHLSCRPITVEAGTQAGNRFLRSTTARSASLVPPATSVRAVFPYTPDGDCIAQTGASEITIMGFGRYDLVPSHNEYRLVSDRKLLSRATDGAIVIWTTYDIQLGAAGAVPTLSEHSRSVEQVAPVPTFHLVPNSECILVRAASNEIQVKFSPFVATKQETIVSTVAPRSAVAAAAAAAAAVPIDTSFLDLPPQPVPELPSLD